MNRTAMLALAACLAAATGCQDGWLPYEDHGDANALLVRSPQDEAIRNAIIRQHTLFEYHFVPGSADLNELGLADLAVLTEHFRNHPGQLNIRRGTQPDGLYRSRIDRVVKRLAHAGVDARNVPVGDEMAGGDGKPSREVIEILRPKAEPSSALYPLVGSATNQTYGSGGK